MLMFLYFTTIFGMVDPTQAGINQQIQQQQMIQQQQQMQQQQMQQQGIQPGMPSTMGINPQAGLVPPGGNVQGQIPPGSSALNSGMNGANGAFNNGLGQANQMSRISCSAYIQSSFVILLITVL
eukprot:NODE_197_length_15379_cov_0.485602.p8 type:complete len:124 gc:universal NODE_197_length_15379_cov_0.485602:10492-10121(-)